MTEVDCIRCGTVLDVQTDGLWWYQWEEKPSKQTVEQAIAKDEFRDWFQENHVACTECHRAIQRFIQNHDTDSCE